MGRTILSLLNNGDISQSKAAEAIVQKFVLAIEPKLPKWRGFAIKAADTEESK